MPASPSVPLVAFVALSCVSVAFYVLYMRAQGPAIAPERHRAEQALAAEVRPRLLATGRPKPPPLTGRLQRIGHEVPDAAEQARLRDEWAGGVSHVVLPDGAVAKLQMNARPVAAPAAAYQPESENPPQPRVPEFLVTGATFALTGWNPMGREASQADNERANTLLRQQLHDLRPPPSHVLRCYSVNEETGWKEEGFAVRFERDDAEVEREVLRLARRFGQAAVYKWHSHRWGPSATRHATPVQHVVPTAPDLRGLASAGPVRRIS